jgi:thiol-disulfide isomerase/thioredoxin
MGTPLAIIALLSVGYGNSTTMKGSEAYSQLRSFEKDYQANAVKSGTRINAADYRKAVADKANDLLNGVDIATVPGSEGRDWARVLETAQRIPDAITLLDRYVASGPAPAEILDARAQEARDNIQIAKFDEAANIARGLKPTDDKSARTIAIIDEQIGVMIGQKNFDAGMKFLGDAKSSFTGYEKTADPILKAGENNLTAPRLQESLPGTPAPEFTTVMSDKYGAFTNLADLKGKVVILDFFAHWCPPCKASMPDMRALSDELGNKVEVLGVTGYYGSFGTKQGISQSEEFADMKGFMDQYKMDHPVIYIDKGEFAKYGVTGIPEFVLIGKDGKVLKVQVGYSKESFVDFRTAAENAAK